MGQARVFQSTMMCSLRHRSVQENVLQYNRDGTLIIEKGLNFGYKYGDVDIFGCVGVGSGIQLADALAVEVVR
jgi:hypothetical protein